MSIVVVIPSRGRPERAREAIRSIRDTAALVTTSIVLAVDEDDPELDGYRLLQFPPYGPEWSLVMLRGDEGGNLVRATNTPAMRIVDEDPAAIVGVLNDDQVARTPGWDKAIASSLATPGIAYGDDLFQHDRLVTCPFISGAIVRALGWYALPTLEHLFIDNAWHDLGQALGVLRYHPELVFEHLHPFAGKGDWDDTYERGNAKPVVDRDRTAYEWWRVHDMRHDVARVRGVLEAAA